MIRFLVPHDGSPGAASALEFALSLARAEPGCDLQLLNVQPPMTMKESLFRQSSADVAAIRALPEAVGREVLAPAEAKLDASGVPYAAHVRIGDPAPLIAKHAEEYHCSDIVMGTRGMGLTANLVLGSIASKIVHLAAVPVTLVKAAPPASAIGDRLLVPVDGSENAERAAAHALELARRRPGLTLHLLNVQPPIDSGDVRRFVSQQTIEDYYRAEGGEALAGALARVRAADVPHAHKVLAGPFAQTIADYAQRERCYAIVMGTRGMGGFGSWVFGSNAMKVIHLAEVPVTLVR